MARPGHCGNSRTGCLLGRLPDTISRFRPSDRKIEKRSPPRERLPIMHVSTKLLALLDRSSDRGNPEPAKIKEIMESVRSIAVVGISRNPEKPARRIPAYLAAKGYDVIPVNPFVDQILGKKALDSLDDVDRPVDMVLVFRPSEEAAAVAKVAMKRSERPVIWLQEGIRADEVAHTARAEGIQFVQDLCTYEVHRALVED
jgi:predicted CoA-binding protein